MYTPLHGSMLELYRRLDALFAGWAGECGAEEYLFPAYIPAQALARLNYFESFPHLATFPVALDADPANLHEFAAGNASLEDGTLRLARLAPTREVLTPAACYHFYHTLQGLRASAPLYLTTRATCFRREAHFVPMERQWSFSMREIACIGTGEEVKDFLGRMQGKAAAFLERIRLPVRWQAATDPFFDPSHSAGYLAQRLDPVKTEMVLDGRLAVGSVNFHRNYFGEAFDLQRDGAPASSGCIAFGLERWTQAVSSVYGTRPEGWPLP